MGRWFDRSWRQPRWLIVLEALVVFALTYCLWHYGSDRGQATEGAFRAQWAAAVADGWAR